MQLQEFQRLSNDEKLVVLYERAVYLAKRTVRERHFLLYQLSGFYIEIQYAKYRQVVQEIKCFDSTQEIKPYLDDLQIDWLILWQAGNREF